MKLNLKNALIATSIAAGLFGGSAIAIAQSNTTPATMPEQGMQAPQKAQRAGEPQAKGDSQGKHRADRMAKMQKRMAERQAQLKAALKLTPDQEAAWSAFVARTAPEPRVAGQDRAQRGDWSKLTTPERLDKMQARHAERGEKMAQRIDATKSFYAALTPEQQKTFDTQGMRAMGGKHRGGMKGDHQRMGKNHHRGDHEHGQGMHKVKHMGEKMGQGKPMVAPAAAATPAAPVAPAPAVTQ
ncbi:Spy/CpxP family protein refolding chaperone [Hydrogenophaga sp. PAMC20947]|uniref:Spy/CpxP family protein refolding chaperone n=1 Tax=Hydrogenophaga sp. PAMC20947 TaxID=2565558 RepID=UPI00109DA0F7|nr:Spy/CpxP family protein refolding chaperone [Hydrogenophaga sp. PAMC20947]QCB47607.1 hypothetical protein E5678_17185 [Hydrogenophaga sp. PAMC20947]